MQIRLLEKRFIVIINKKLLESFGIQGGAVDEGKLDAALEPYLRYDGEDPLFMKAGLLIEQIVLVMPFTPVSGNDRTAFEAARLFLGMNGYHLEVEEKEIVTFLMRIPDKRENASSIGAWLKKYAMLKSLAEWGVIIPLMLATMAFDHSSSRWFGACLCRLAPKVQTFISQIVLRFYKRNKESAFAWRTNEE